MALWSNQDVSGAYPKFLSVGRILRINVTAGGTGYTNGATTAITIGAPGAGGVQATGTALVSGGIVQSITITNAGSKYTTSPTVVSAGGTGLTVSVVLEPVVYDSQRIFFVDATEASQASNKAKGVTGAGWWYFHTYVDGSGDTRYKTECLVAMGTSAATSGDLEDAVMLDSSVVIAFSLTPVSSSVTLGTILSIAVTSGGTGYVNGGATPVVIDAPTGSNPVQAVATANVVGGIVQSITVTNPGSGYILVPAVSMGTGTGLVAVAKKDEVTFTSTAAGVPSGSVTYQWQVAAAGSFKYVNVGGATSANLTVTGLVAGDNGKKYRVKAFLVGSPDKTTGAATLTVV